MYTTYATPRTIEPLARWAICPLIALLCAVPRVLAAPAGSDSPGGYLYLLSGTPTPYGNSGFPVRLYSVSQKRLALVRQVSDSLFAVADDLSGHLYVIGLGLSPLNVIHENAPGDVDVVPVPTGTAKSLGFSSFFDPDCGAIAGPDVPPGMVFPAHTDHWTVFRILADATPGKPRVTEGSFDLFGYFRYPGPGGGPYRQGTVPGGVIQDGKVMVPYSLGGGAFDVGPVPPFLPPTAGAAPDDPSRPRGADLVADTAQFFAFDAPWMTAKLKWPRTVYVLNKATSRWSVVSVPFYANWPRLFGTWLATTVAQPNPGGRVSPGEENERAQEVDVPTATGVVRELPVIRGTYGVSDEHGTEKTFFPGELTLQNLGDNREITIDTGQEDSEVLDASESGLVLYRVNDSIYSAQIEGSKLSAPTLVVKDDDVPEVHWAFWSGTKPASPSIARAAARP